MMSIGAVPIERGILFKFIEDIENKTFSNKTNAGIVIKDKFNDMQRPRWGKILVVGPQVTKLTVGDYVLIENLQWTTALRYKDDTFWKTNEDKVMMVSKNKPVGIN